MECYLESTLPTTKLLSPPPPLPPPSYLLYPASSHPIPPFVHFLQYSYVQVRISVSDFNNTEETIHPLSVFSPIHHL
ncbi:hypothetical protein E2C01_086027 [Portunus trituberculatus]|uniref:Uncharacterized protein n=1 Tax=Portunus trituberculatus TaxID=210409 RepID=A0A5B7JCC5_PORTR|nr:hypothetical protein [Portunus trituberculatus]